MPGLAAPHPGALAAVRAHGLEVTPQDRAGEPLGGAALTASLQRRLHQLDREAPGGRGVDAAVAEKHLADHVAERGQPARGERTAKYNRLLRIESMLREEGAAAPFGLGTVPPSASSGDT